MSKCATGGLAAIIVALAFASPIVHGQQLSSQLTLPFTTPAVGTTGGQPMSGTFRIVQFSEQNGQAFAVGTLTIALPAQASTTAASTQSFVTQAVVPVLALSSRSTTAALTFSGGAGTGTSQSNPGNAILPVTTAGVPASAVPGQVANCGPVHVEVGPIDVSQAGVALHLDRLAVDIAPPSGGVSTMLSEAMCSADAALAQASTGGTTAGTALQQPGFSAPVSAGATATVGTAAATMTAGMTTAGGGTTTLNGAGPATPLQSLVLVLNQVLGML